MFCRRTQHQPRTGVFLAAWRQGKTPVSPQRASKLHTRRCASVSLPTPKPPHTSRLPDTPLQAPDPEPRFLYFPPPAHRQPPQPSLPTVKPIAYPHAHPGNQHPRPPGRTAHTSSQTQQRTHRCCLQVLHQLSAHLAALDQARVGGAGPVVRRGKPRKTRAGQRGRVRVMTILGRVRPSPTTTYTQARQPPPPPFSALCCSVPTKRCLPSKPLIPSLVSPFLCPPSPSLRLLLPPPPSAAHL